jgi:Holliday junction resolvasome RuvABC endonuclease subunit
MGLDLATRTGFCWGTGEHLPVVGHYDLPRTGDDVGRFLATFERWLLGMISRVEPELVVIEAPILGRHSTLVATRKTHALAGVTEMVCHKLGVACGEVAPATVKKVMCGFGTAGKDEMIEAARGYGLTITCSDEADAFGVWVAAVRRRRPQWADRWTPLRLGARA